MPWIREGDAGGPNLKDGLPNVIKVMSINPRAMFAVLNMAAAFTFGASSLTRVQEEAIATAVSEANKCRY